MQDAKFYDSLRGFRLAVGHKSAMNLAGNRKSVQKGTSAEFSDFREYLPGDDIRRIDWNAYGRLDRLYIKEYMEEKEALISILIDTSASMDYGTAKKGELACELAAVFACLGQNGMDRVEVYDMQKMRQPFVLKGGKTAFPRLKKWLEQRRFEGRVDILEAVRQLPAGGQGAVIILSDFLQEDFLPGSLKAPATRGSGRAEGQDAPDAVKRLLRFLDYNRKRPMLLHILAGEELSVDFTGTHNLIDMESGESLRLTLDAWSLRAYENALSAFTGNLRRECAGAGAFYAVCSTARDFRQLVFQDLRLLYDI